MSASRVSHRARIRTHDDAPDTEAAFHRLARLPRGPERERIREEVTRAWLPMAYRIASRYRGKGESIDDLRQVAALALVKAVDRYEPGRGKAFEAYAVPTITGEVRRHFRDYSWSVHVPRSVQEIRNNVRIAYRELSDQGREPAVAELARRTGLSEGEVRKGLEALHCHSALSLDAPTDQTTEGEPPPSLASTVGTPDPRFDTVIDREAVRPLIARLPDRERRILYHRYFHDMTQKEIAAEFGITQVHVSRILATTCANLRRRATADA
ncbi:SigB/SigF/SigG family RNA polymerase sigma factor [Streptomyces sp. NPDC020875]|uniref:SigB/SigF/SigG family RNA polymerase sigma factor n=1 Tax=Streptomyces sp. NPDC020875 TaxID=3154898 RepID=UPI0033E2F07D